MSECSLSSDVDYQILFVEQSDSSYDSISEPLKLAFKYVDDRKFEPEWISEAECLKIGKRDSSKIYVCDLFSGKSFDHLVAAKCRVVGPQCILKCLSNNQPIPRIPNPLYAVVMKDIIITCTNMERNQKESIENTVVLLGGVMSKPLVPSVTHLITNDVGSKKYFVAGSLNVPIMLPSWIDECWKSSKVDTFDCNDPQFLDKHRCPLFKGCTITVSQISSADRIRLSKLVDDNGGTYSGTLECHKTTHLVLTEPTGRKYASAKRWKVHCVTPQWIFDSVEKGYCIDWSLYEVNEAIKYISTSTSTPEEKKNLPKISDISKLDFSRIDHVGGNSNVDETYMAEFELSMMKENKSRNVADEKNIADLKAMNELNNIDIQQVKKFGLFLDGCKILINGFSGPHLEKLQRIINFGGGTRFSQLSNSVTHIIVNSNFNPNTLKPFSSEVTILHVQWLIDCCKQGQLVPEASYVKGDKIGSIDSFSPLSIKNKNTSQSDNLKNEKVQRQLIKPDKVTLNKMEDVLSQYSEPDGCSKMQEDPVKEEENPGVSGVFDDMKIYILPCFKNEEHEFLVDVIETRGGIILGENGGYEYAVVPVNGGDGYQDVKGKVVTSAWIEYCATEEKLVDHESDVMFQPLPRDVVEKQPLKNCVITLSLYSGVERETLMEIAQSLGAVCQEFFLRVPKGDSLANTHLVVSEAQGSKYSAAKRWNIPTVTKEWLLDTIMIKEKPDEVYYDVDKPTPNPIAASKKLNDATEEKNIDVCEEVGEGITSPKMVTVKENVDFPELVITPIQRRKSQVQILKDSSDVPRSEKKLSAMTGTPARYLDLSAMSAAFDSPEVSNVNKKRDSNQTFQDDCQRYLKLALEKHGEAEEERPDVCADERPLSGVIVVVSKKLAKTQGELNNLAASLGADYRWSYDDCCTHLVHQGKTSDMSRDYRKAKLQGKHIVSTSWLYACQEENKCVDEALYPFTFNPKMNLSSQISSKKFDISIKNTPAKSNQDILQSALAGSEEKKESEDSPEPKNELYKKLDDLMSAAKSESSKKSRLRRIESASKEKSAEVSVHKLPMTEDVAESCPPESQGAGPITWDDPVSRQEREKIAEIPTERETQDNESMPVVKLLNVGSPEDQASLVSDNESPKKSEDKTKRFLLTGFSDIEKQTICTSIDKLNGVVIDVENFDKLATHLIASKPSKSEKFLSAIAAGLWVLTPLYIEDSIENDDFLREDDYEWGSENILNKNICPAQNHKIVVAARRWRMALENDSCGKKGAFDGWKVILNSGSGDKQAKLFRLLDAGRAQIADVEPPYSGRIDATHAFIEISKKNNIKVDWENLMVNDILCLRMDYIPSYLRDGDGVNSGNFTVEDVKTITNSSVNNKRQSEDLSDHKSLKLKRSRIK